ncbi:transposase [Roseivirga sp. BDSF3-8]|uniref:transposase n=1 Tax=Roseivirga sp. BDSF3-8 TaxID=3241598 RepID=UPI0035325471
MRSRVFSESFKRDKVRMYETGKMSVSQLSKTYQVSETSIYKWIDRFRSTPASERIVVETESDYLQVVELQERMVKMERLIGNQQMMIDYQQSVIAAAKQHYGEDIEKKFG